LPGLPIILTKTTGGFLQCFHVNVTTEPWIVGMIPFYIQICVA
jgi:hypothetical protein